MRLRHRCWEWDSEATPAGNDQADKLAPADNRLEEMIAGATDRTTLVRLWNRVLDLMRTQTSRDEFNTWVRRTALLSIANGLATVGARSAFFKKRL
jgi:DnaA N-terminal domain